MILNDKHIRTMLSAAAQVSPIISQSFNDGGGLHYVEKDVAGDFQSEIDRHCEEISVRQVKHDHPGHPILGEEGEGERTNWDDPSITERYVLDPLDGTKSHRGGSRDHGPLFSREEKRDGIWVPTHGLVYMPAHGVGYIAAEGQGAFKILNLRDRIIHDEPIKIDPSANTATRGALIDAAVFSRKGNGYLLEMSIIRALRKEHGAGIRMTGNAARTMDLLLKGERTAAMFADHATWDISPLRIIAQEAGLDVRELKVKMGEHTKEKTEHTIFVFSRSTALADKIENELSQIDKQPFTRTDFGR